MISTTFCFSQDWLSLGQGASRQVNELYYDSTSNVLLAGGGFLEVDGIIVNCIAQWDGQQWDSLGAGANFTNAVGACGNPVTAITKFQGSYFIAGMLFASGRYSIGRWGSASWDSIVVVPGIVSNLYSTDSLLYVTGTFDSIGGIAASGIATWNGTTWSSIDTTRWEGDGIYDMEFYNGELYVGGNFNHWDLGINSVAKWNGTSWEALANGIVGTASAVNDLYVHDGLLYAGGLFSEPFGNPGTAVVAWNGTTWESPGSGLGGLSFPRVNKMIEYSGKLYAVGAFLEASGIDASMLASWDGLRWCTHGYSLDNEIFTIEHFRDTLVIGGAFRTIDVDSFPYIAAWDGGEFDFECSAPTGPKDLPSASELELSAYPNPAVDWLHLKLGAGVFTPGGYEVRLLTVDGRLLSESNWTTGRVHSVSLDALPAGFYIVAVQGAGQRWTRKVSVK